MTWFTRRRDVEPEPAPDAWTPEREQKRNALEMAGGNLEIAEKYWADYQEDRREQDRKGKR